METENKKEIWVKLMLQNVTILMNFQQLLISVFINALKFCILRYLNLMTKWPIFRKINGQGNSPFEGFSKLVPGHREEKPYLNPKKGARLPKNTQT